jgi:hypothetical protein
MADGTITTLLNSGIDAFNNLFDVIITLPTTLKTINFTDAIGTTGGYDQTSFSVRAMGFTPPELSLGTTQVDYKAIQLTRQTPKITGDRTFTIEFRVDATYNLYYQLSYWKHIWMDPSGEGNVQIGVGDILDNATKYGKISVTAYAASTPLSGYGDTSSTTNNALSWDFFDVICSKIGTPTFARSGSDFVTVTAEFIFGRFNEPGTSVKTVRRPEGIGINMVPDLSDSSKLPDSPESSE